MDEFVAFSGAAKSLAPQAAHTSILGVFIKGVLLLAKMPIQVMWPGNANVALKKAAWRIALLILGAVPCWAQSNFGNVGAPQTKEVPVREALTPRPLPAWLHAISLGASQVDVATTIYQKETYRHSFYETDPAARLLTSLPSPQYEVSAMSLTVGLNLLAERVNRSERFTRFAKPLLAAQIAANSAGIAITMRNWGPTHGCEGSQDQPIHCAQRGR